MLNRAQRQATAATAEMALKADELEPLATAERAVNRARDLESRRVPESEEVKMYFIKDTNPMIPGLRHFPRWQVVQVEFPPVGRFLIGCFGLPWSSPFGSIAASVRDHENDVVAAEYHRYVFGPNRRAIPERDSGDPRCIRYHHLEG